jgi:hypothetical protein
MAYTVQLTFTVDAGHVEEAHAVGIEAAYALDESVLAGTDIYVETVPTNNDNNTVWSGRMDVIPVKNDNEKQ